MEKGTQIALFIAICLIVVGVLVSVIALRGNDWSFSKSFVTNEHQITDTFKGISIKSDTADIDFLSSADGVCRIVIYDHQKIEYTASVTDNTLLLGANDTRKWYQRLFTLGQAKISVYLPTTEYGALLIDESTGDISIPSGFSFESMSIKLSTGDIFVGASASGALDISGSTGDIDIEKSSFGALKIALSTGDVSLNGVNCAGVIGIDVTTGDTALNNVKSMGITSTGSTGDICLTNTIVTGALTVDRSTGDIEFNASDASEITVTVSTGDVTGTLCSDKIFLVSTSTGRVNVPKSTTGGIFKCESSTGNVIISINQ